jgi:cytochrome c556
MTLRACITLSLLSALALGLPEHARADDQDTIDYRRTIMRTLEEQQGAIQQILHQKTSPENFAVHAQVLAITSGVAKKAYEAKVPGNGAKPNVWTEWADFSKRLDDLNAATAALAKSAKEGGIATAGGQIADIASKCKGCHEIYREPQKQ